MGTTLCTHCFCFKQQKKSKSIRRMGHVTHMSKMECLYWILFTKRRGNRQIRCRRRWNDNVGIHSYTEEVSCENVDWICPFRYRDHRQVLLRAITRRQVPSGRGALLSSWATIMFCVGLISLSTDKARICMVWIPNIKFQIYLLFLCFLMMLILLYEF